MRHGPPLGAPCVGPPNSAGEFAGAAAAPPSGASMTGAEGKSPNGPASGPVNTAASVSFALASAAGNEESTPPNGGGIEASLPEDPGAPCSLPHATATAKRRAPRNLMASP